MDEQSSEMEQKGRREKERVLLGPITLQTPEEAVSFKATGQTSSSYLEQL